MKFFQIFTYPEKHLHAIHASRPHLLDAPFKEHAPELGIEAPESSSVWCPALNEAGHESFLVVANNPVSQCRWAAEKLDKFNPKNKAEWARELVIEQLRKVKPDVLIITDPVTFSGRFLERLKNRPRWVVAWTSGVPEKNANWRGFDLVVSPHAVAVRHAWKKRAGEARMLRPGFSRAVAEAVFQEPIVHDVVYCGKWIPSEEKRNKRITALAKAALRKENPFSLGLYLDVPKGAELPSAVQKLNLGAREGLARFRALASARLIVAEEAEQGLGVTVPASVFEGVGVGVCTLAMATDELPSFFKPEVEIVTYASTQELITKVDEYLGSEKSRTAIAKAGQERCLTEHTLEARMKTLLSWLEGKPGGFANTLKRLWYRIAP